MSETKVLYCSISNDPEFEIPPVSEDEVMITTVDTSVLYGQLPQV